MTFGKMTLKRNDRAAAESAARAQRDAHVIAAGAIVFQVARVMREFPGTGQKCCLRPPLRQELFP